jgi:hypothetical protein
MRERQPVTLGRSLSRNGDQISLRNPSKFLTIQVLHLPKIRFIITAFVRRFGPDGVSMAQGVRFASATTPWFPVAECLKKVGIAMILRTLVLIASIFIAASFSKSAMGSITLLGGFRSLDTFAYNSNPYGEFSSSESDWVYSAGSYGWTNELTAGGGVSEQTRAINEAGFSLQADDLNAYSSGFASHRSDSGQSFGSGSAVGLAVVFFTANTDYIFDLSVSWNNVANNGLGYLSGFSHVQIVDNTFGNDVIHEAFFSATPDGNVNSGSYTLSGLSLQAGHTYYIQSSSFTYAVYEDLLFGPGINHTHGGHFASIAMSNLTNPTLIPEPGSFLVWCVLGLASVGFTNRRRMS